MNGSRELIIVDIGENKLHSWIHNALELNIKMFDIFKADITKVRCIFVQFVQIKEDIDTLAVDKGDMGDFLRYRSDIGGKRY